MMSLELALQDSYLRYQRSGARAPDKLFPLHQFLGQAFKALHSGSSVITKWGDIDGELKAPGAYYPKNVDVAAIVGKVKQLSPSSYSVPELDQIMGILGIKFVVTNFKQNANNYFENMMGETANIQQLGIPYSHFIALPVELPYLNKDGSIKKTEKLSEGDLSKYVKLMAGPDGSHKPASISIALLKFDSTWTKLELLPDSHLDSICSGATKHLGLHSLGIPN
jgi:hypothetical protein